MKDQQTKWPVCLPDHFPNKKNQTNNLFLITGDSGIGKTTWCEQWVASARADGWRVGGLLSLSVITNLQKVAIELVDLTTDERRSLATLRQTAPDADAVTTRKWLFDTAVLDWGNEVLRRVTAVDLLIIDELGPLEFEQGRGLQSAFDLITMARYRSAGVVIRPALLTQAQQRWPWAQTISIAKRPGR